MTLADVAARYRTFPDRLAKDLIPGAGDVLARAAEEGARRAGPMRNLARGRLGSRQEISSSAVVLIPDNRGAWTLATVGTGRHWWIPRGGPRQRARRIRVGTGVRWAVEHGPIRGRHAWTDVIARIEADLPAVAHAAVAAAVGVA